MKLFPLTMVVFVVLVGLSVGLAHRPEELPARVREAPPVEPINIKADRVRTKTFHLTDNDGNDRVVWTTGGENSPWQFTGLWIGKGNRTVTIYSGKAYAYVGLGDPATKYKDGSTGNPFAFYVDDKDVPYIQYRTRAGTLENVAIEDLAGRAGK